jgi:hypothetical protein
MKIKIDSKQISTLKSPEGYRKWKQEVTMLVKAPRYPRLLNAFSYNPNSSFSSSSHTQDTPHTPISTIPPDTPLEISRQGKGEKGEEDDMTQEDWAQMSEQIISQVFFFLVPIYRPIIYNLEHKNLPFLFTTLDKIFINSDTMVIVAKRSELDDFSFKLDKTFPEQLMKFDEQVFLLKELGGTISEQDNIFILIKALSLSYKEKLSNILSMQPGQKTYPEVRQLLLQIFERDMA